MRRRPRLGLLLAGVLAGVLALTAACASGDSEGSATSGTIHILVVNDSSGPYKLYGEQELLGIQAAAKYLNSKGGISKRKVQVTHLNDNGDASTAVNVTVKELSANPGKYSMIWPGTEGTEIAAMIPVVQKYKLFAVSIVDAGICSDASKCPYQFSSDSPPSAAQIAAASWMKQRGYTKVGILAEQIAFAKAEVSSLQTALKQNGITFSQQTFAPNTVDVTPQVAALKDDGAKVIFAAGIGPAAGYTLNARDKTNWDVPVLFDAANSSLDITKLVSASRTKNAYLSALYCQDASQQVKGFDLMVKNAPAKLTGQVPCQIAGSGWSSVLMFAHAAEQAKSTDYKKLTEAAENLSPSAQADPLYVNHPRYTYSSENHQNIGARPSDTHIIPVGPLVNGRVQPSGG